MDFRSISVDPLITGRRIVGRIGKISSAFRSGIAVQSGKSGFGDPAAMP